MGEIIAGIDIGTSKVATVVGLLNENNEIEVLGRGIELCNGVKKGTIVDIEGVYAAVCSSIKQAETMSNIVLKSAFINLPSAQSDIINNRVSIEISDKTAGVKRQDVNRVLEVSRNLNIPFDRQIVDVIARQYFVDEYEGVKDPVGMKGVILGVDVDIILGKTTTVDNLVRTLEMSSLRLDGIIVDSHALSEVALTPDEKEFGTVLIDVGGTTTDIIVFKENELICSNTLALGGENITKDLSLGLKIPMYEAEKLKREYAFCIETLSKDDQKVSTHGVSGEKKDVNVSYIAEIIEARSSELIKLSFDAFRNTSIKRNQITGIVMTGGGISYIDGCIEYAKEIFQMPIRIPSFKGLEGVNPELMTGLGILRYVANHARFTPSSGINISKENESVKKAGFIGKLKGLFNVI